MLLYRGTALRRFGARPARATASLSLASSGHATRVRCAWLRCAAETSEPAQGCGLCTSSGVVSSSDPSASADGLTQRASPSASAPVIDGGQPSPVVRLFSLPVSHLTSAQVAHFAQLQRLLHRLPQPQHSLTIPARPPTELMTDELPPAQELFVMSRVITARGVARENGDADDSAEEVFTGVNHAFHKRVNHTGATLRGILKGCAEQNALGAAAAGGCAYADVTEVFLRAARRPRSVPVVPRSVSSPSCGASAAVVPADVDHALSQTSPAADAAAQAVAIFPCPECWRHLCHVARARQERQRTPLRLFVFAASPAVTVQLLTVAGQRARTMAEPMEVCIVTA